MTGSDAVRKDRTERWFVRQGLPNLIDHYSVREDVLTRMFPFLGLVVFLELFLVFGDRWNGWSQAVAFLGGVALMLGAFLLVNRLRRRPLWMLPDRVGVPEVLLFLVLPAIPHCHRGAGRGSARTSCRSSVQRRDSRAGSVLTAWGLIPMMRCRSVRWAPDRRHREPHHEVAPDPVDLLGVHLPQRRNVAGGQRFHDALLRLRVRRRPRNRKRVRDALGPADHRRPRPVLSLGRRAAVCDGTPVVDLVPADEEPAPDAPRLGRRAEWNVALLLFVSQAIQILLVALVITAFYLLFGLLTVRRRRSSSGPRPTN